jgi:hypothetical protein
MINLEIVGNMEGHFTNFTFPSASSWFSCLNTPHTALMGWSKQDLGLYTVESGPNELPKA